MSEPYAGPKDGDYVAYLEELERVQWAQMVANASQSGAALPGLNDDARKTDQGRHAGSADAARRLSSEQARAVRDALAAGRGETGHLRQARGALLPLTIGLALAIFGLIAEGGLILLLIGAVVAFSGLRKLLRALNAAARSARAAARPQATLFQSRHTTQKQG